MGRKNQPFFQLVVIERGAAPKGGRAKEMLGSYDPLTKEKIIKKERVKYWLSVGAEPSDTVHNMLVSEGVIEGKKKRVHAKSKKKEEVPEKVVTPVTPEAKKEPVEATKEQAKEKTGEVSEEQPKEEPKTETPEEKPVDEKEEKKE